ncbi:MAG: hypothetical protein HYT94_01890 [Parcubacteria group bacterium]|nr:hypothetical protein [Parcubacteria group bacterium]
MQYLKHLKKYFIPGKHNEYKPHFFRLGSVLVVASVIAFLFLAAFSLNSLVIRSGSSQLGAVVTGTLVELANADRESNNLQGLTISPVLQKAAQLKADDMAAKSYFAHDSPEGLSPWHWFEQAGYVFSFAGENLAVYFSDSAELEKAWMNSPLHRANILNSYFTEIGIATAKGVYQGRETVYVVQEFGRPKARVASAVAAAQEIAQVPTVSVPTTTNKLALKESPKVKGATAETEPFEVVAKEDTFIAVKSTGTIAEDETATNSPVVVGTADEARTSPLLKAAASPWTLLRKAYAGIALFIVFALLLLISVEIKRQHPLHIFYAVALLVLMGVLLYSWQGFFFGKLLVL